MLQKMFLLILTVVMGITGIIGGIVVYNELPTEYFRWYPSIPLFYYLMGIIFVIAIGTCKKKTNIEIANLYLAMKILKVIATIIFMGFYMWLIDERDKDFVVAIGIFYFIYLILETCFYFNFEKSIKKKKDE